LYPVGQTVEHSVMGFTFRPYVTASVALVGASIIAVTPVRAAVPGVHVADVQLTAGDGQITLDLVRHADNLSHGGSSGGSAAPGADVGQGSEPIAGGPPGAPLGELGREQADAVTQDILAKYDHDIAGVYASGEEPRMYETAQPLADALGMNVQELSGLNEIDGGIYAGHTLDSPAGILYLLTLAAWAFGLEYVQLPGSPDINGVEFNDIFSNSVQDIYDNTTSDGGPSTAVAVSGEAAITAWALMNANNPDFSTFLPIFLDELEGKATFLPNVGQVVLQGEPGDWNLVSFNGTPVPPPDLLTSLFVDLRDLITAPQRAAWHIYEAVLGGDPTTIESAFQTGFSQVGDAIIQFPQSVINDILDALGDGSGTDAGTTAGESFASLF
jgi:broad specificity phosphatase PhoE